jgi:hypothetical protein
MVDFYKKISRIILLAASLSLALLILSCPKPQPVDDTQPPVVTNGATSSAPTPDSGGDATDASGDSSNAGDGSTQSDGGAGTDAPGGTDGSTAGTGEDSGTTDGGTEEEKKPVWKVEGVLEGSPLKLAAGAENEIILNFALAKGTHYNEESPLSIMVAFVPEKAKVDPLELNCAKPADIPKVISFKVTGLTDGMKGDLAFDIMAFFCSDEGYCMRRTDTITLNFEAAKLGKPAKYKVNYPLEME